MKETRIDVLIKAMEVLARDIESRDGVANAAIQEAAQRMTRMAELIDGAYDIVELWKAKTPSQIKWRKDWMEKARTCGATPS